MTQVPSLNNHVNSAVASVSVLTSPHQVTGNNTKQCAERREELMDGRGCVQNAEFWVWRGCLPAAHIRHSICRDLHKIRPVKILTTRWDHSSGRNWTQWMVTEGQRLSFGTMATSRLPMLWRMVPSPCTYGQHWVDSGDYNNKIEMQEGMKLGGNMMGHKGELEHSKDGWNMIKTHCMNTQNFQCRNIL